MSVTLSQIKQRVRDLVDTESADFVDDAEILRYINEGIKKCEAWIHKLNEDYYKKDGAIAITSGSAECSLPSDIYAQKIRRLMFNNGTNKQYEVRRIRDEEVPFVVSTDTYYRYRLVFNSSDEKVLKLYPTPTESDATSLVMTYIKDAKQLSADTDVTDIPEFSQVVVDFTRYRVLVKEVTNPMLADVRQDLKDSIELMVSTLQQSIPDGNNEILLGDEIYQDFYSNYSNNGGF